jgi:hypothetical protein
VRLSQIAKSALTPPLGGERDRTSERERDDASGASGVVSTALRAPETYELRGDRLGYSLRPRTQRNYKE